MNAAKRVFKFQLFNLKKVVLGFWAVMITINIVSYIISMYFYSNIKFGISLNGQLVSIAGGNFMPIVIFFIAYGIVIYHENFRLALNFGATRQDFYKTVIGINIISAFIFSVVQTILQLVDKVFVKNIGLNPVVDIQIHQNPIANFFITIVMLASIFLFLASIMNIVGILQYKYTYKFWIGFGIAILFSTMLFGINIFRFFLEIKDLIINLASVLGVFTIPIVSIILSSISYIIGYILFRRVNC